MSNNTARVNSGSFRNFVSGFMFFLLAGFFYSCGEEKGAPVAIPAFDYAAIRVNGNTGNNFTFNHLNLMPVIKLTFTAPLNAGTVASGISLKNNSGKLLPYTTSFEDENKTLVIQPQSPLQGFSTYFLAASPALLAQSEGKLRTPLNVTLTTGLDSTDKFPRISDIELLTKVQSQTFKYFWDFGHPVSGLARERNTSGDVVTTGGSGFGIMAIVVGIHRNFVSRDEGLARLQKIVSFLKNDAKRYHGAYPHWLNGNTGATLPFSEKDNGADLVETSFLMQGLLTARQYFDGTGQGETALREDINTLWREVEWDWFRKNKENVLYWHWSPTNGWDINMEVHGWNEALVTYVLATASPTHAIPAAVYHEGWAGNGGIRNGNSYYGIPLPLGPANGGPLFFSHYSFLGINPNDLSDTYANYQQQNTAHARINWSYSRANPKGFYGYSNQNWGLTASDDISGYAAHEPNNDNGVISPTAALSSFPYTPVESMAALKFFYYKLGDKVWREHGFVDAFSMHHNWFASSHLAIDQGPIILMIENHRSGLLWNLFMSCPEVKIGMRKLGFVSPHL